MTELIVLRVLGDVCLYFAVVGSFPLFFSHDFTLLYPALLCAAGAGVAEVLDRKSPAPVKYLALLLPLASLALADEVMEYLTNSGVDSRLSYRIALCMEEIGAYAQTTEKRNDTVKIYFRAKITYDNEALLVIFDDGKCIYFNQDDKYIKLITDNYALIKRIAKSTEYQYILNMNYIMINL